MALRDYCEAGKMALRNYHATGKELISTSLDRGGGVQNECEKLQGIVREAKTMIMDLEWLVLLNEGDEKVLRLWKKFERLYCEADDALDEFSYEAMRIHQMEEEKEEIQKYCMTTKKVSIKSLSLHNPLLFLGKMSLLIKKFQHTIDEVKGEMKSLDATSSIGGIENHEIDSSLEYRVNRMTGYVDNKLVFGRIGMDEKNIVQLLIDPNNEEKLSVIPILLGWWDFWGYFMGEMIIKFYLDHELIRMHFGLRIWVDVSSGFDVKCIVKEIIEQSLGRNRDYSKTWDNLQCMLEEILSGKRFVLVLYSSEIFVDPDKEKWDNLTALLRVGSRGSKIIIVTIDEYQMDRDGTLAPYFLEEPTLGEKWSLFNGEAFQGVGGTDGECEELVRIGMKLVKECGYSSCMLRTLASMMCSKTNIQEWKSILNTWKSVHSHPYSTLVICYHALEPSLRRCFIYSYSAFGSGSTFQKKKLIQLWMAEGLLEEATTSSSMFDNNSTGGGDDAIPLIEEDIGNAYFNSLVVRNFFQVGKLDDKGDPLECEIVYRLADFAKTLPSRHLFLAKSSSSQGFRSPHVLECTHLKDEYLSSSIIGGRLKHLRYLDLSYGRFKALPNSICKLYHLQTLKLLHCSFLQRLPRGMRKLINLRHLEIERTLLNIPRGLRKLSNLQTLTWFRMGNINNATKEDAAAGIEELGCLQQLGGSLGLIGLNNVKDKEDAKAAKLNEKRRLKGLTLEWESTAGGEKDSKKQHDLIVLEGLQPHQNLLVLRILLFSGTQFPTWLDNNHLSNLQELCIYSCHHVKSLDVTGLRSLKKLQISHCENLEYTGIKGLLELELLEFKRCDKLKSLIGGNQSQVASSSQGKEYKTMLPSLAKLWIESCDHLTNLPQEESLLLQSLKTLHIESCGNQTIFMDGGFKNLSSLQDLQIENCPNLRVLSDGTGQLKSLEHFSIGGCPQLMLLLTEMQHWRSLQTLTIFACENLWDLPRGIGMLTSLEQLEINGCGCFSFPYDIQRLKYSLRILKIEQCPYLRSIPTTLLELSSLTLLEISSCNRLTSLPGGLQDLTSLVMLKIKGCEQLEKLPEEMGNPSTLRVLAITGCPNLTLLPDGLGNLQMLIRLEISDCCNLQALPMTLGELSSLQSLYIQRCRSLASIPNTLPHMKSLQVLWLIDCANLANISSGLQCLSSLEKLTIWGCHNLVELLPQPQGIQHMESLKELTISNCSQLEMLPSGLEELSSLTKLVVWECPKLRSSESMISKLRLRGIELEIKYCPFLKDIIHPL